MGKWQLVRLTYSGLSTYEFLKLFFRGAEKRRISDFLGVVASAEQTFDLHYDHWI